MFPAPGAAPWPEIPSVLAQGQGCELGSAPQLVENARGVPCAEGSRLLGGASDEFGSWCLGQLLALPLGWLEGAQGWWWHRV